MIRRMLILMTRSLMGVLLAVSLATAVALSNARHNGQMLLSVQSGSMRPAIAPGDAVMVRAAAGRLAVGDIISFRSASNNEVIITHRITAIQPKTGIIITKGDALESPDPAIGLGRVVGRVERVLPKLGYSFDFLRHPAGLFTSVHAPAMLLAYSEIRRLQRHYAVKRYYFLGSPRWLFRS